MVKKLMVPVFVTAMMLIFTSAGWAATNTFSIGLTSGDAELGAGSSDLSQINIGLTVPLNNKLEFNGEFTSGEIEDDGFDSDTTSFKLKGDYRIYQDRTVRLDLAGGYYQRNDDLNDYKVSSLTVGIDGRIRLDKKLSLYTGLHLGLLPNEESNGYDGDPDSLYLFHLKLNYLVNSQFGLAGGYFRENIDSEWGDRSYSGLTAGVFFRF